MILMNERLIAAIRHGRRPIGVTADQWRRAVRQYKRTFPGFTFIDPSWNEQLPRPYEPRPGGMTRRMP
jgi:hypothetical protein